MNNIEDYQQTKGQKGLIGAKIDLEIAYNDLEWPFIKYTLQFFQFPQQTIDLIMASLTSSSISVLWNGKATSPFTTFRGVCYGMVKLALLHTIIYTHCCANKLCVRKIFRSTPHHLQETWYLIHPFTRLNHCSNSGMATQTLIHGW